MISHQQAAIRAVPTVAAVALGGLLLVPLPGNAQPATPRLIDWPIRNAAQPEAVIPGARALFWNPAGAAELPGRAQLSLLDLVGPDGTELDAFAAAGALRLGERTVLGIGYAHFGLGTIPVTTTTPNPEGPSVEVRVAEDELTLGGARSLGERLSLGVAVRYARAELGEHVESRRGGVAGATYRLPLPGEPMAAAALLRQGGATRWIGGVTASLPRPPTRWWTLGGGYGLSGGDGQPGSAHRLVIEAGMAERASITLGASGEPDGAGREWLPLVAADVRLGRYVLGALREQLPNDFGAAYSYRLDITF